MIASTLNFSSVHEFSVGNNEGYQSKGCEFKPWSGHSFFQMIDKVSIFFHVKTKRSLIWGGSQLLEEEYGVEYWVRNNQTLKNNLF